MAIIRVQHSFQGVSGIPEDRFVNVFHFTGNSGNPTALAFVAAAIKEFYQATIAPGTHSPMYWMAGDISGPGATIKMYDLADLKPRQTIYEETYDPPQLALSGTNLPSEVALCLSYAGDPQPGVPIARQRGRLYIGPMNQNALSPLPGTSISRPDVALQTAITANAKRMASLALTGDAINSYVWSVYSPTLNQAFPIIRVWCDDAWDTQRRRGEDPTSRVAVTL